MIDNQFVRFFGKCAQAIPLLCYYIVGKALLHTIYKAGYLEDGKWLQGGKYGAFTATGWRWVVNDYFSCRKAKVNREVEWPVSSRIGIVGSKNIKFHPDDLNNFQAFGNYYQGIGEITIGRGTYIAPNVGIITSNHSLDDLDAHDEPKAVVIGERCWIGMNSMILPGVALGEHTIVGAGSVVTKSFPIGDCVIAGNPAKIIRMLNEG